MNRYCKAYAVARFREFTDWPSAEGAKEEATVSVDDYWFLHDDYVVTRGIRRDEEVIFSHVTPDWVEFCRQVLEFTVPNDLHIS